jgi:hypothetical protein
LVYLLLLPLELLEPGALFGSLQLRLLLLLQLLRELAIALFPREPEMGKVYIER